MPGVSCCSAAGQQWLLVQHQGNMQKHRGAAVWPHFIIWMAPSCRRRCRAGMLSSYTWRAAERTHSRLRWRLLKEPSKRGVKPPPATFFTRSLLTKLALANLSPTCFGNPMLPTSKGLRAVHKSLMSGCSHSLHIMASRCSATARLSLLAEMISRDHLLQKTAAAACQVTVARHRQAPKLLHSMLPACWQGL